MSADPRLARLLAAFEAWRAGLKFGDPMSVTPGADVTGEAQLFLIFWDAMQAERTEAEWQPVASCPLNTWVKTRLEGEAGENECFARIFRSVDGKRVRTLSGKVGDHNDATDTEVEWISRDGRSTSMHHSFAAPSHWRPL